LIDTELLQKLFQKAAEEKLAKEIREWIIYTAPPEILKIYTEYMELKNNE
jgi:hypothetical protein